MEDKFVAASENQQYRYKKKEEWQENTA